MLDFGTKVRMARNGMGMSAQDFADLCELSEHGLLKIENLITTPNSKTIGKIERTLTARGWKFVENGVVKEDRVIVIFDDYVDVLNDVQNTLKEGEEVLFHRADDRRSSPAVLAKLAELKAAGIRFKSTICAGNTFITGNLDDYRQIDKEYFQEGEVEVVFGDKYMIHERAKSAEGSEESHYFVIRSKQLAATKKKDFYYWWRIGQCLTS